MKSKFEDHPRCKSCAFWKISKIHTDFFNAKDDNKLWGFCKKWHKKSIILISERHYCSGHSELPYQEVSHGPKT